MKEKKNSNRRAALKTIGTIGIASALSSGKVFGQIVNKKAAAFALIGDGAHQSDYIKKALDANIVNETDITIDYTGDAKQLTAATLDGYRMLITCRGRIGGMTVEQQKAVQAFVQNGGAAVFLHNSTDIAKASGTEIIRDVIGGYWLQHSGDLSNSTATRPYRVRITNTNHPITQGVKDFEITGEQHYNQYDKDPRYVFMKNETIDGWAYNNIVGDKHYDNRLGEKGFGPSCPSGWAYDYGRGRVCFMAQGHTLDVFMNEEYRKLQKNAALWALKRI